MTPSPGGLEASAAPPAGLAALHTSGPLQQAKPHAAPADFISGASQGIPNNLPGLAVVTGESPQPGLSAGECALVLMTDELPGKGVCRAQSKLSSCSEDITRCLGFSVLH